MHRGVGVGQWVTAAVALAALAASGARADPPREAVAHYEAGLAAKQAKDYATAVRELKAALGMDEGYVDAHWVLAWVYAAQSDTAAAIEEFGRVVRLAPDTDKARQAQAALDRLRGSATRPPAPAEGGTTPQDGLWRGKGADWTVEFIVDGGGVFVRDINGWVSFPTTPAADSFTNAQYLEPHRIIPVRGGRFASLSGATEGRFDSPTEAQGTLVHPHNGVARAWTATCAGSIPESARPVGNDDLACLAIQLDDADQLRQLIAEDPNCLALGDSDGRGAPHFAAACAGPEVLALLADQPALDWEGTTTAGDTALHIAAARGRLDVLELLLDRSAGVDRPNKSGKTPLHLAAEGGRADAVAALLKRGADVNGAGAGDQTPLALALANGHTEVAELLRKHGAAE